MIQKLLSIFKASTQTFEGKVNDETVLLLLRRHRFFLYLPLSILAVALLAPVAVYLVFSPLIEKVMLTEVFLFFASLWCMTFWLVTFYSLTLYTLNTVVVTNKRLIDNDQYGLFNRKISELHLYRVQDVSVHTNGLIETFLNFGDIIVQTAASEKQFVFHQIANPEEVKNTIMQIVGSQHSGVRPL